MYCAPADLLTGEEGEVVESEVDNGKSDTTEVDEKVSVDIGSTTKSTGSPHASTIERASPYRREQHSEDVCLRGNSEANSSGSTASSSATWGGQSTWQPPRTNTVVDLRPTRAAQQRFEGVDQSPPYRGHHGPRRQRREAPRGSKKGGGDRGWSGNWQPSEPSFAWPDATDGRIYDLHQPTWPEVSVSSALPVGERQRRSHALAARGAPRINYVLATARFEHMFYDDGAESFLAPVQPARIDFLDTPMDENETGLIEVSPARLYCVFCDKNKECSPSKMMEASLVHLRSKQHKSRRAYYREQIDMCAEFNQRLELIKSHQIFLKLIPSNSNLIPQKYWCHLCDRGLKGFLDIRNHLKDQYHTQRVAMHVFCEKQGMRLPSRRLGEEVANHSHFVDVPSVEHMTKDELDRNGIVITDGINFPQEPSGWLFCTFCRKKFSDPQRMQEHCGSWRHRSLVYTPSNADVMKSSDSI